MHATDGKPGAWQSADGRVTFTRQFDGATSSGLGLVGAAAAALEAVPAAGAPAGRDGLRAGTRLGFAVETAARLGRAALGDFGVAGFLVWGSNAWAATLRAWRASFLACLKAFRAALNLTLASRAFFRAFSAFSSAATARAINARTPEFLLVFAVFIWLLAAICRPWDVVRH